MSFWNKEPKEFAKYEHLEYNIIECVRVRIARPHFEETAKSKGETIYE